MAYKFPDYPSILTDKDWQKKKGALAKTAGETGVGAAMDAAQKAHADIRKDAKNLDLFVMLPHADKKTRQSIDDAYAGVLDFYNKNVEGELRKKIIAVRDKAKDAAEKFEKSKTIPKSSGKHAREVEKIADQFMVSINKNSVLGILKKDYDQAVSDFDKHEKFMADNTKRLKGYIVKVAKGVKSIKTASEFNGSFWDEDIRGVGTALPLVSKDLGILVEHKVWRTFASEGYKAGSDEDVPAKLKQIAPVLKKIADAVQKVG